MNTLKIILVILLLVPMCSCNKLLDINPVAEAINEDMFNTPQGCEEALYGVYGTLQGASFYGKELSWGITEVLAQHFGDNSNEFEPLEKYNYGNVKISERLGNLWANVYQAIGYTNNIIENLEAIGENAYPLSHVYLGETYGLRAMLHFDLLRLFAPRYEGNENQQGIPYVVSYSFVQTPFSTVGECYNKVVADLKKAQAYLQNADTINYPVQGGTIKEKRKFLLNRQGHLNYYGVTGLLARVLWAKNDLPGALAEAMKVINSQKFTLVKSPDEVKNLLAKSFSTKETIFGFATKDFFVDVKDIFYSNGNNSGFFLNQEDLRSKAPYEEIYKKDITANDGSDSRNSWFGLPEGSLSVKHCFKFANKSAVDGTINQTYSLEGCAVIRLAEMYYIVAEAKLAANDLTGATVTIDSVLVSRGIKALERRQPAVTLTQEFIYNERHKEFFCEGLRWFDMKKRHEDIASNAENRIIKASNKVYTFPIPAVETNNRFNK